MEGYRKFGEFHFTIWDWIVFIAMLVFSTGTGIYFGYYKREKVVEVEQLEGEAMRVSNFGSKQMHEYLLGSRKLKIFPVAMSLVGSYISGVTMLGVPSEVYNYGAQYWIIIIPIIFMAITVSKVYLPVFATLRVGSSYEYLELRFSSTVRSIASFMFVMDEIFFLPMIVFVPAIAFNQATGLNVHAISVTVCICCVIYTLVGGIKAVVHTDAWQILVMFVSLVLIVILGCFVAGGPKVVFQEAYEGGRLNFFNTSTSLYDRQTLFAVLVGGYLYWTSFNSVNQTMVQRYMSLPSLRKAEYSIAIFCLGIVLFLTVSCFAGLLLFAYYRHCDPLQAKLIANDDQLLPLYVLQTVGHLHGIPGLFIAGVFGAALSSLSVVLNSTALVLLEDIVKGCFKANLTIRAQTILVKSSIVVLGIIALSLVFVLERLSGILGVATSMTAIAAGTTCGLFTLGMLVPWSNNKGAIVGAIVGLLLSGWVSIGSQAANASRVVTPHKLELSVEYCMPNTTLPVADHSGEADVFPLYRLSFHWITPIGLITTITVGILVSLLTGPQKVHELDADLISPVLHRFLPPECFRSRPEAELTRDHLLTSAGGKKEKY